MRLRMKNVPPRTPIVTNPATRIFHHAAGFFGNALALFRQHRLSQEVNGIFIVIIFSNDLFQQPRSFIVFLFHQRCFRFLVGAFEHFQFLNAIDLFMHGVIIFRRQGKIFAAMWSMPVPNPQISSGLMLLAAASVAALPEVGFAAPGLPG